MRDDRLAVTPDADDDWAYGQLMQGREMWEVYQEWRKRIPAERLERLSEPYDAFKKAMRRRRMKDRNPGRFAGGWVVE